MDSKNKNDSNEFNNQEKKKSSSKKIVSIFIGLDILLVIIIILLLCLKSCKNNNNAQESSDGTPIDIERNNRITDLFKGIVKKLLVANGYDDDYLTNVNAISYADNYPNNFTLNISVSSLSKVYYCSISDYPYEGGTSTYDNFLSYLLLDTTEYKVSKSSASVNQYKLTDKTINTSKDKYKYVISESNSEPVDTYIDGFYLEDGNYYIYQNKLVVDNTDPFTNASDQIIDSGSTLYGYYRFLMS